MLATIAVTVNLYIKTPKGYFPQDDTGLVFGSTQAAADISYDAMVKLQRKALDIVLADPAVAGVGSSVGASGFNASVNQGRMFISLKPLAERGGLTTQRVVDRMRRELCAHRGHQRLHDGLAGHPRRRAAGPGAVPADILEPGVRHALCLGAQDRRPLEGGSRTRRRQHRPRAGRAAGQHHHRPADGVAPRRAHAGHRQRAQQRFCAAPDLDHLYAAQPVPRRAGGRPGVPARSERPVARVRAWPGRCAGAARRA